MLQLYNSLTDKIEPFEPSGQAVSVYVCGITPYDTTHLGHAFTYAVFDVLIRYLEHQGHPVRYTQNVTDIDDDILRKAREVGDDWQALGNQWTAHFIRDLQTLNVRPPDHLPRATDFIEEIVESVERLIQCGVAYESGGSVYFDVNTWDEFGKLSDLSRAEMLETANERGNNPDDPNKRNPLDFVLWQAKAEGEPSWPSPWGEGRPGWHIECSTMAAQLLGETIDIHGGGADLLFPHHECEIAQAECATGRRPFSRFWMHTAMVHHEGEKMSKSLGNLVMVRDLLEDFSADALRIYMASYHYRTPWAHSDDALNQARSIAERLAAAATANGGSGESLTTDDYAQRFTQAMDDDLNSPAALDVLEQLAREILTGGESGRDIAPAQALLQQLGAVLGLRLDQEEPETRVIEGWGRHLTAFS
jgi:L-cysteine:1D-myo-inositol 2-amino-2-deoxy-alpha-D-glucopyranoside ligase